MKKEKLKAKNLVFGISMVKEPKSINGVEAITDSESGKIGKCKNGYLVFAKCGKWEAQLAKEAYVYGQLMMLPQASGVTNQSKENMIPKFLGQREIPCSCSLIKLIDVVSQVMCKGLGKKRCEKVYLASLNESRNLSLHFRLIPRCEKDKERVKKVSGFFLISDYVREYLSRSDDCRKKECCVHKGPYVPFGLPCKNGDCTHQCKSYEQYAEECQKWFAKGWERVQKQYKSGIKCRMTK